MDALIEVSSAEFNEDLFKRVKSLLKNIGKGEITIKVNNSPSGILRHETQEQTRERIENAISETEPRNFISYTAEEFIKFSKELAEAR